MLQVSAGLLEGELQGPGEGEGFSPYLPPPHNYSQHFRGISHCLPSKRKETKTHSINIVHPGSAQCLAQKKKVT